MANQRIWAPERLAYVKNAGRDPEDHCIFCALPETGDDETSLIIHRGESSFVILNRFPYTSGHLMVVPFEHVGRVQEIPSSTLTELMDFAQQGMNRLDDVYEPQGYNIGINQGKAAGAGVDHHIHLHVVPRWGGDTNFMPVTADTRVMPQSLEDSYEALRGGFGI